MTNCIHAGFRFTITNIEGYWRVAIRGILKENKFVLFSDAYDWATSTIEVMVQETKQ
jgi:hypothetical protein